MPDTRKKNRSQESAAQKTLPRLARIVISVLLIVHLTIVVCAPLVMVTPRSSLAAWIVGWGSWYLEAGNVSHGYAFFAPEPGPSHVIEYDLLFADGRKEHGKFPDLDKHQPRQRYHRHFMLTEQLSSLAPRGRPPGRDPIEQGVEVIPAPGDATSQQWVVDNERFMQFARSYARHLLIASGAKQVQLRLFEREIPTPQQVLDGRQLDDKALYVPYPVDPLVVVTVEDES
jgi:hypothetical protein